MFSRFLATASLGCALLSISAGAQDQTHYTYVSHWAVPRGEWANFEKQEKDDDATMQKLVADGTIISWGDASRSVHTESGYTHSNWFTATSRANLLKALEVLSGSSSTSPAIIATTKHEDEFLHTIYHGGKSASAATGYLRVAFWQIKPDSGEAFEFAFKTTLKPLLDQEVTKGTLLMYNFDAQEIHSDAPGGYNLAMLYPDGAAMDRFYDDLTAAEKENSTAFGIAEGMMEGKEHRDMLFRVTAFEHK